MKLTILKLGIVTTCLGFFISNAHAEENFFQCDGIGGIEEYRVGVNLKTGQAGFFDNDNTSYLKLSEVKFLETAPPQILKIFEGTDVSSNEKLKLNFNVTRKNVTLFSIDSAGKKQEVGEASCYQAPAWDDLK